MGHAILIGLTLISTNATKGMSSLRPDLTRCLKTQLPSAAAVIKQCAFNRCMEHIYIHKVKTIFFYKLTEFEVFNDRTKLSIHLRFKYMVYSMVISFRIAFIPCSM